MGIIETIQLDPNGFCNAKCWYCPVRYEKLPNHTNMSINDLYNILDKIIQSKYTIDSPFIYTAHYNEILLYPYLKKFLDLLRHFKLKTIILTNGTNLIPEKYDMIGQYPDIVCGINLNTPAISEDQWIKQTGLNKTQYEKLTNNLNHIKNNRNEIDFSIGMNGFSENFLHINNGTMFKMKNFPEFIQKYTLNNEYELFKEKYPEFNIYTNTNLVDRNSLLEKNKIYSHTIGNLMFNKKDKTEFINCQSMDRFDVLHINSFGNVFACCNDYNYDYVFGNIIEQNLDEIWESNLRKTVLEKARREMCVNCISATWK